MSRPNWKRTFDLVVRGLQHRLAIFAENYSQRQARVGADGSLPFMQVLVNSFGGSIFASAAAMQAGGATQLQGTSPAMMVGGFLVNCCHHFPLFCLLVVVALVVQVWSTTSRAVGSAGPLCLLLRRHLGI